MKDSIHSLTLTQGPKKETTLPLYVESMSLRICPDSDDCFPPSISLLTLPPLFFPSNLLGRFVKRKYWSVIFVGYINDLGCYPWAKVPNRKILVSTRHKITEWDLEHSKENSRRTNNTNDPAKRASMLSIWINDEKLIKLMQIK